RTFKMADSVVVFESHWPKYLKNVHKVSSITIAKQPNRLWRKGDCGKKGYKCFTENYIHNVFVKEDNHGSCFVKVCCFRSQKKSRDSLSINLKLKSDKRRGTVTEAKCS
ncbi:hypothetical protein ACROYT_G000699, partial [Oculina patagonica]